MSIKLWSEAGEVDALVLDGLSVRPWTARLRFVVRVAGGGAALEVSAAGSPGEGYFTPDQIKSFEEDAVTYLDKLRSVSPQSLTRRAIRRGDYSALKTLDGAPGWIDKVGSPDPSQLFTEGVLDSLHQMHEIASGGQQATPQAAPEPAASAALPVPIIAIVGDYEWLSDQNQMQAVFDRAGLDLPVEQFSAVLVRCGRELESLYGIKPGFDDEDKDVCYPLYRAASDRRGAFVAAQMPFDPIPGRVRHVKRPERPQTLEELETKIADALIDLAREKRSTSNTETERASAWGAFEFGTWVADMLSGIKKNGSGEA